MENSAEREAKPSRSALHCPAFRTLPRRGLAVAGLIGALSAPGHAIAATPAATTIVNVAAASFDLGNSTGETQSNQASLVVLELLGIGLSRAGNGSYRASPDQSIAVPFTITNAGNGHEAFVVSGAIVGINSQITGFAIDRDGNGLYDPSIDTAITQGSTTPTLDAGASVQLLALLMPDAAAEQGTLIISAHAATGYGRPGTLFPGQGDGGTDAMVGSTTAAATLSVPVVVSADAVVGSLVKSEVVLASDGSDRPVHGAVITYTIDAHFDGTGPATGSVFSDPIPDGTDYVPGSLHLDSAPLTDAGGDDAGQFTGSAVQVSLGDVIAPATRSISFAVKVH